jgi:hypothetical protein
MLSPPSIRRKQTRHAPRENLPAVVLLEVDRANFGTWVKCASASLISLLPDCAQPEDKRDRRSLRWSPYLFSAPSCPENQSTVSMTLRAPATPLQFSWHAQPRNPDQANAKKLVALELPCRQPVPQHAATANPLAGNAYSQPERSYARCVVECIALVTGTRTRHQAVNDPAMRTFTAATQSSAVVSTGLGDVSL